MPDDEITYPLPGNEKKRLESLYAYHILDTIPEKEYDSITKIAAQICNVPASLITLLDKDRQWFKSNFGFQIKETPRAISFCNYTILDPEKILVVPDLRTDERFANNPLVTGEPHAVFYAGAPLVTPGGVVLGSICVLDGKANDLNEDQKEALGALANQIITKLELHKKVHELTRIRKALKEANNDLKNFALIVSHDMKTPLANILMMSRSLKSTGRLNNDEHAGSFLDMIDSSAEELLVFIDEVLMKSEKIGRGKKNRPTDTGALLKKIIRMIAPPQDVEIKLIGKFPKMHIDATSLQQIFQNLMINSIKYNDKKRGMISIHSVSDGLYYHFIFADNGAGIEKSRLKKIFSRGQTTDKTDRYGNTGTGHGLFTIKKITSQLGGKISVTSEKNKGSNFKVSLPVGKK
jgi:signal transduction histidine kinase